MSIASDEDRFTYGADDRNWVYCTKCGMAITLEERCVSAIVVRGSLAHGICPHKESRPMKTRIP